MKKTGSILKKCSILVVVIFVLNLFIEVGYAYSIQDQNYQLGSREGTVELINELSREDRLVLSEIIGVKKTIEPSNIFKKVEYLYGNIFTKMYSKFNDREMSYLTVVEDVANHMKVETKGKSLDQIETEILLAQSSAVWEKLSPTEKEQAKIQVIEELKKENVWYSLDENTRETIMKSGPIAAIGALMEIGGFHTFEIAVTLITKTMVVISGLMGITIPFAVYAGVNTVITKTLGVLLGPWGWGALVAYMAWNFWGPDYKRLTGFVTAFALYRRAIIE